MVKAHQITDWDDAYANRDHIPRSQEYIDALEPSARRFRQTFDERGGEMKLDLPYGENAHERYDLFHPNSGSKGVLIFVHGGYWVAFDKGAWSHYASSALAQGWSVAMVSYSLCPQVRIADITQQIGRAIEIIGKDNEGPIVLAGHSAGGHLVSRMGCKDAPLEAGVARRIQRIISISGVHDLRPLMRLSLNETLHIDTPEANSESPALLVPREGLVLDCVVGEDERPEFVRQNALLANVWTGLGAQIREIVVPGKHHFSVIDELLQPEHGWLVDALKS